MSISVRGLIKAAAFAAVLIAVQPAQATLYQVDFTGTPIFGSSVGPISGSFRFDSDQYQANGSSDSVYDYGAFGSAFSYSLNIGGQSISGALQAGQPSFSEIHIGERFSQNLFQYNIRNFIPTPENRLQYLVMNAATFAPASFSDGSSLADMMAVALAGPDVLPYPMSGGQIDLMGFGAAVHFSVNSFSVSSVPLPAALPLFGAGLAGLAVIRKRRSNA